MKTKILYIITKSNWGGAQRYVYDLATAATRDFDVAVALGGDGPLKEKLELANIRVVSIPGLLRDISIIRDASVFFFLIRLFQRERPDVVHLNSSKIGSLGALAARIARVPKIIFTAHGWAFNEERSSAAKIFIRCIVAITLWLNHTVIAVSHAIARDTHMLPGARHKITVIHNGIEPFPLKTHDEARQALIHTKGPIGSTYGSYPQQRFNLWELSTTEVQPRECWIGIVAELHRSKGVDYAIRAMGLLRHPVESILCVIGDGEERKNLESLIRNEKLGEQVFLLGHLDDARTYLAAFDVLLAPSITEALGYTLLEAGIAGLPVIASRVGGIHEIIEDQKNGILIGPQEPPKIARALDEILSNPEKGLRLGENLRARVVREFSLTRMIEKTFALYRR